MAMAMFRRAALAVVAAFLLAGPAAAQSPVLSLAGKVRQPQHWTFDLKRTPFERADVSYLNVRVPVTTSFTASRHGR